jgi:hypothetical protein
MWQAHRDRWFPPVLRGVEIGAIDVVQLDADVAGCVSTWLRNGGHLTPERSRILAACVEDLDAVIGMFTDGEELHYLLQLRIMAAAVLARRRHVRAVGG